MSRGESGVVVLHSMCGGACGLAERGSKAPGSKYLPRTFMVIETWVLPVFSSGGGANAGSLNTLRILRLARLTRMVRIMRAVML